MLEGASLYGSGGIHRVVDYRMTDVAVVRDDFAGVANVFAVVATEAAGEIKVTDVIRVGLPVGLHLGEEVGAKDSLDLGDGTLN